MARKLIEPLKAWGTTILGPAATTERALSLLAPGFVDRQHLLLSGGGPA
jgi:hypothetical protein